MLHEGDGMAGSLSPKRLSDPNVGGLALLRQLHHDTNSRRLLRDSLLGGTIGQLLEMQA